MRHTSRLRCSAAVLLLVGSSAVAQTVSLPPALPWSGASEKLIARQDDPWITPAERADFVTTPSYVETRRYLDRLLKASPLLHQESFGTTPEGRELILVRASKGGTSKPVILVQAGIHSGEIDGKDASLMLLRDIALRGRADLLDHVDVVFVPIYNADGHERVSPWNRPDQRGPQNPGSRTTAQHINLNRDYAKADALETQSMLRLLQRLDPILYLDTHVSDGFDHGYDVTFTFASWGVYSQSRAITQWLTGSFQAGVEPDIRKMGHHPIFYPAAIDERDLPKGLRISAEGPRYSTGYGDYAHIPTVLVEMHCLKPYRQRVLGTYTFLEAAIRYTGQHVAEVQSAIRVDRTFRPTELPVLWKRADDPIRTIPFNSMQSEAFQSPISGARELRYLGRTVPVQLPLIGDTVIEKVTLPKAWWVPAAQTDVLARLDLHGIHYERITSAQSVQLDTVTLRNAKFLQGSEQRARMSAEYVHAVRFEEMPAGSVRVPSDQPKGLLAASLLEPESQDSFFQWGFFPEVLQREVEMERYLSAPYAEALLAKNSALNEEFQAKLAADPAFAADGAARLNWVLDRSHYRDPQYLVYPIGREVPMHGR